MLQTTRLHRRMMMIAVARSAVITVGAIAAVVIISRKLDQLNNASVPSIEE